MPTAIEIPENGQLTLNKELMYHLHLRPGEKVVIKEMPDRSLKLIPETEQVELRELFGLFKTDTHLSDEELEGAIRESWRARAHRG